MSRWLLDNPGWFMLSALAAGCYAVIVYLWFRAVYKALRERRLGL